MSHAPLQWPALLVAASAWLAVPGCTAPARPDAEPPEAGVAAQACAERLHQLCADLLLYNAQYRILPPDLTELASMRWTPVCPATREPYLYNPAGWPVGRTGEFVILADARPAHLGHRMGIVIQAAEPGQSLVLKVASLPADFEPR